MSASEKPSAATNVEQPVSVNGVYISGSLLTMMSDWSEGAYYAGWMSGTEEMLHEQGGVWEILGRAVGWPTNYEHDPSFAWVTWDEAGAIFAARKTEREARRVAGA